jgi:hypothetical protein
MLAGARSKHHHISQTFIEYRILKRHWITSLKLVEHGVSLRPIRKTVQSQKFHARERIA